MDRVSPNGVDLVLMAEQSSFADFVRRIRAGDEEAAREVVRQFEPVIRLEVRRRLSDPSLYRIFDSMDICQSVLATFFVRASAGQYDLEKPEQLAKLLVAITQKKLAFETRKQHYQRRDTRRTFQGDAATLETVTERPGPERQITMQDLVRTVRDRLTTEERQLADLRVQGHTWPEIAAKVGGAPQARRRQLERALDRVARHLRLDEVG
jgi:RNA polymerase sigma-70 factor (ECF subfamily)